MSFNSGGRKAKAATTNSQKAIPLGVEKTATDFLVGGYYYKITESIGEVSNTLETNDAEFMAKHLKCWED